MKSSRFFYGRWIVVASILGLMVCNGPVVYTVTVFIPPLVDEFGWGRGDISMSVTFHTVANAIAMPIAGKLVDKFGARRVLAPSILVWGIGVGLISMIPVLIDRGIASGTAALGVSVMGLSLLFGRVWAGYLMDRHFAPYVAIGFICCPIAGCLLLAGGAAGPFAFVAAAGIGLGIGAEVDFIAYLISRYFGLKSFGVLYGYLFGAFLIGGGIRPPLMGYGHDLWGTYGFVLYLFAIVSILACVLLSILGPYPAFAELQGDS